MKEHIEKIYMLLTALSKIFDTKTFDIHRDTIKKLISIDNMTLTNCMSSLNDKHHIIDFTLSNDMEYTVTLLKESKRRLFLICENCTKKDFEILDKCCLEKYRKEQQEGAIENE